MRLPLFIVKTAGTKSWFVPHVLEFLCDWRPKTIAEPFAGSGVVGLSLLNEGFTKRLVLAENDEDYLAFWRAALGDSNFSYRISKWTERVLDLPFEQQAPFVEASLRKMEAEDRGFWTLLRTRLGFNGKKVGGFMTECNRGGVLCRWPRTLDLSLDLLYSLRNKITVMEDCFDALAACDSDDSYAFVDPTYTLTPDSPGHDLYDKVFKDHPKLLSTLAVWKGRWQLTYNDSRATRKLLTPFVSRLTGNVNKKRVLMNGGSGNGGSEKKPELVISRVPENDTSDPAGNSMISGTQLEAESESQSKTPGTAQLGTGRRRPLARRPVPASRDLRTNRRHCNELRSLETERNKFGPLGSRSNQTK